MEPCEECDVAIVGLGPTGAILANLLGRAGWSVVGLERDEEPYYAPRAVHFDDEAMRIFQYAGLSGVIGRTSEAWTEMEFSLSARGAPVLTTQVGSQDRRYGHAGAWWFHQPTLERHLREGLARFANVRAHYGCEVRGVTQDEDGVTIATTHRDGTPRTVRARYAIGCDGGRSFVRTAAGLSLDSAKFDEAWVVVDTKTRSGAKHPGLPPNHRQICNPSQPVTYVPLAGPYYEWQFMVTGGKSEREATDPAFVRRQLRDFVDLGSIEITRIAYYRFHALWANRWRRDRVLLAGDAAHMMPPFLGQGMCSGIRDAHNLSWRLDLVLSGAAGPHILDDYETERSAHVQHIIKGAMLLGRTIQTRSRATAFVRNQLLFRTANAFPAVKRAVYDFANRKLPLEDGFLGRAHRALSGRLSLQPEVTISAGRFAAKRLLDDALGPGFAVLARRGALGPRSAAALARLRKRVPLALVEFDAHPNDGVVGDDGTLTRWFDEHRIDFALIRPDRYIFDAGKTYGLDGVVDQFCAQLERAS